MGAQIIDASIVSVPTQHNSRDENTTLKASETHEDRAGKPAKFRQKTRMRGGSRSHGESHYGYKNHVNVDRCHKLVRRYHVTDASVHDEPRLRRSSTWTIRHQKSDIDSAYRSAEIEEMLAEKGLTSRIHRESHRDKPLSQRERQGNKTHLKVRVRVEHVWGSQSNDMGGARVPSIGIVRAKARIGLKNLTYNMRRRVQLERLAVGPP